MSLTTCPTDMTGMLLVSTPAIQDPAFRRSVILVCAHSPAGALGVMVNRPATNMTLRRLFQEHGLEAGPLPVGVPIFAGGPAHIESVIVVHRDRARAQEGTRPVTDGVRITPRLETVADLARRTMPDRYMIAMGHCAWGRGRLETELFAGKWLLAPMQEDVVFSAPATGRWDAAMRGMHVPPAHLSGAAGNA